MKVCALPIQDAIIDLRSRWLSVKASILSGSYRPMPVRRVMIPKPDGSERQLGIPTVLDRLSQQALLQVLQPIIDPTFSEHSYGFRPGRSAHQAILKAQEYVQSGRKARVRQLTRRSGGRSIDQVVERLRPYLLGWKQYFRLSQTPKVFRELDEWLRHRLRVIHLKHWKRGKTAYAELIKLKASPGDAERTTGNMSSWWRNGCGVISRVLDLAYFERLGLPSLS
jgi:Group II intron, maturase-specific domain/Reverse transcriptase (RNA-dependent DNA polymerase)